MALASWDVLVEPSPEFRQEVVARNGLYSQRFSIAGEPQLSGESMDEEDNLMTLVFKSLEGLDNLQVLGLADILEASIARRLQRLWTLLTSNRAELLVERLESMSTEQRRLLLGRVALEQVASIAESVDLLTKRGLANRRAKGRRNICSVCDSGSEPPGQGKIPSLVCRPRSFSSPEPLLGLHSQPGGQERPNGSVQGRTNSASEICNKREKSIHKRRGVVEKADSCNFPGWCHAGAASLGNSSGGPLVPDGGAPGTCCGSNLNSGEGSGQGCATCPETGSDSEAAGCGVATCDGAAHDRERRNGQSGLCKNLLDECGGGMVVRDAMGRCLSSEDLGREERGGLLMSRDECLGLGNAGGVGEGGRGCRGVVAGSNGGVRMETARGGVEEWEDADAAFMLLLLTENKEKHVDRRLALHLEYIEGFYGFPVENVNAVLDADLVEEEQKGEALRTEGWQERLQEGLMQNLLHLGLNVSGLVGPGSNLPASIRHYVDTIGCFQRLVRALKANEAVPRTGAPPAAASVITRLPSVVVSAAHIAEGAGQCSICRERLRVSTRATQVPCGHLFHVDCILPWLRRRNSCPVCRFELPTDDLDYELLRQRRRRRGMQDGGTAY